MGSTNTKMKIPTELTESEIEILKLNTNMTHNEVCTWYKEFYEFSNGRLLDQGHFIKYYKDLLPYKGDPEEFCKLAFNDFSELIVGFTILSKGEASDRLKWMFTIYDQNNDGSIDSEELKSAVRAILTMKDKNFRKKDEELNEITQSILKSLDKNSDDKISLQEFLNGTLNNKVLRELMCPDDL